MLKRIQTQRLVLSSFESEDAAGGRKREGFSGAGAANSKAKGFNEIFSYKWDCQFQLKKEIFFLLLFFF
jgi:hypothetical protein